MAVVSVRKLSELGGARRIDAEYYQPSYIEFDVTLSKIPSANLGGLCEQINRNPMCYGFNYVASPGIPFFRIDDLYNPFIEKYGVVFVSDEVHHKFLSTALKTGDILMGVRGNSIGRLGIYKGEDYRANISPNLIYFRLFKPKLSNYVATVLLSRVGRIQIQRILAGTGQPTITSDLMKQIRIPIVEGVVPVIDKLTENAFEEFEKATMSYSHAEDLLLEQLGLKDFKPMYELSYTANLSKAFGLHRIDAEYFQPAYEQVTRRVLDYQNGYTPLLGCVEAVRADFDPAKHPDNSFNYVELADIDASIGVIHSASEIKGEEAPSRARRVIRRGDVIVSSVEGSLEKIALVDEEHEGSLASTGFFQFRAGTIRTEVLLVLSKSIILQAQLKRECAGTILTAVPNGSLKRILVPVLPPEIQQKITSLIQQSHEARRKARELLKEAKNQVEEAIETASLK